MTDLDVYLAFKKACPFSKDSFEPSEANRHRWLHHIQAVEKTTGYEKIQRDFSLIEKIRAERQVREFGEMPWYAACRYLRTAQAFPGFQIFACGSRVRGDYVDAWDDDSIRIARKIAGMSPKKSSDFDFWVEPDARQIFELPAGMERVRCIIPNAEKIAVPMSYEWDFSKLPESEHERVIELVKARNVEELVKIHNTYGLSIYKYCCDLQPVENWFYYAIKAGIIKSVETETVAVIDG